MKVKTVREILKQLKKDGWYLHRTKESRRQFKHPEKSGKVTLTEKNHQMFPEAF